MSATLKPFNLILINFYLVLFVQLFLNWQNAACHSNSNIWVLFFYILLTFRVINDEIYQNDILSYLIFAVISFLTSIVLVAICAYEVYTIASNIDLWSQTSTCIDNRILYGIWCVFGFLTLGKDIVLFGFVRDHSKYREEMEDL